MVVTTGLFSNSKGGPEKIAITAEEAYAIVELSYEEDQDRPAIC